MEHNGLEENVITLVWKTALRKVNKQGKSDDKGWDMASKKYHPFSGTLSILHWI